MHACIHDIVYEKPQEVRRTLTQGRSQPKSYASRSKTSATFMGRNLMERAGLYEYLVCVWMNEIVACTYVCISIHRSISVYLSIHAHTYIHGPHIMEGWLPRAGCVAHGVPPLHVCVCVRVCLCACVRACVCTYVCMYVCMYVCIYVSIYLSIYLCIYMYIYIYIYMYIYIYIYNTHTPHWGGE